MRRYPGILIGRLGISTEYAHRGIGSELLDFIKEWFVGVGNRSGCRYVIVDAYNEDIALSFYQKNGFRFIFATEKQEIEENRFELDERLKTRLMYYDLIDSVALKC